MKVYIFLFCLQFFIVRCGSHYYFKKNMYITVYTDTFCAPAVRMVLPNVCIPTVPTIYTYIQVCCCDFFYTSLFTCSSVKYIVWEGIIQNSGELLYVSLRLLFLRPGAHASVGIYLQYFRCKNKFVIFNMKSWT